MTLELQHNTRQHSAKLDLCFLMWVTVVEGSLPVGGGARNGGGEGDRLVRKVMKGRTTASHGRDVLGMVEAAVTYCIPRLEETSRNITSLHLCLTSP